VAALLLLAGCSPQPATGAAGSGAAADRTAVALLLSGLPNSVETTRMESLEGTYPPARHLADEMTAAYQGQIRTLLIIAAGQ
jgi:hypothetical protein